MLKSFSKTLLTGFLTILPVVLTIYLLYWLLMSSEQVMGGLLRWLLPEAYYWPGLGMLAGLATVFVVGLLMNAYVVRRIFDIGEQILYRLPVIKTVYRAIRDFFDFFSPQNKAFGQVVSVSINDMQVIGFITQDNPEKLPETFREQENVLVYIPMSYMIGGFTVFIPRSKITPMNMSMDEAMRFTISAGIAGKNA